MALVNRKTLEFEVGRALEQVAITDIHTHLFTPDFGELLLWGIDELLTYHYLVAETLRWVPMPYQDFWAMPKKAQADLVWQTLFVENSPVSEACRGVLTVLAALGLDVRSRSLADYRAWFAEQDLSAYIDRVFTLSGLNSVVMTNDPFVEAERQVWLDNFQGDPRFHAALRLDPLLNNWEATAQLLQGWGYAVDAELSPGALAEVRRFLADWHKRMRPLYMAVSLPPSFAFPENSARGRLIAECVLPVCREYNVPFALMIGVKKLVNPGLSLAGDAVGKGAITVVENLCATYPENKFLVTMLARENQHELCVAARKFRNLMIFGCWWFLNNPSLITEITAMRFELLGMSFLPQHSDARVLDQLIYKWQHSKELIGQVLVNKYTDLLATGWQLSTDEIKRDVTGLLGANFWRFLEK